MFKYKKIVAIVVMVVMAGGLSPAIGQAAGDAQMKNWCQKLVRCTVYTEDKTVYETVIEKY